MTKTLRISKDEIVSLIEKEYKVKDVVFKNEEAEVEFEHVEGELNSAKGKEKKPKKAKEIKQDEED